MFQWQKLIARLYKLDKSLRYEELAKILRYYGYTSGETKGGSSHVTFRKKGRTPITIPRHTPVKVAYIELVRDTVIVEEQINE